MELVASSLGAGSYLPRDSDRSCILKALFGTGLTIADGIFTPAVSITSAVAGIAVNAPALANDVISISIVFLLILFLGQPFGTAKIAVALSPSEPRVF